MAEQAVEALTSGLKVARMPAECLAPVPNPGIGEWEPCARVADGSIALPGRERIRPLFAELHDTSLLRCFRAVRS